MIGGLLFTFWLATKPELSFAVRNAIIPGVFFGLSLAWRLCFLYVLARSRPPLEATPAAGKATR